MLDIIISNLHPEKLWWSIKHKLKFILLFTLLFAIIGGAYAQSNRSSTYQSQVSFYAVSNPDYVSDTSVNIESSELTQAQYLVASYMQILKSDSFLDAVIDETGLDYSADALRGAVSSEAVEGTAVFKVNVFDAVPKHAYALAGAIAKLAPAEIIRVVKAGGIEVVDDAKLPTQPFSSTNVNKYIIIGAAAGFLLSFGWFAMRGLLDTRIRRKYEIEDMFTIPVLGDVPWIETDEEDGEKILSGDSPFAVRESYNNIATKLLFTSKGERCPVYGVTSTTMGEGKSLSTINIAKAYAMLGKKVVLIDADMRKGDIARKLKLEVPSGLSQYLSGIDKTYTVQKPEENFHLITAGKIPPNPSELLAADTWKRLLDALKADYDAIFVDLPPVGIVADALIIAPVMTAYLVPICQGVTRFDKEKEIIAQLEMVHADVCGFIFNGVSPKSADYSYKGYGYDYKYGEKSRKSGTGKAGAKTARTKMARTKTARAKTAGARPGTGPEEA